MSDDDCNSDEPKTDEMMQRGESIGAIPKDSDEQQADKQVVGNPRDVLCGRGLHIVNHHGNLQLHLLVNKYKEAYRQAQRQKEKQRIIRLIIDEIKKTGARFLKRVEDGGDVKWVELDYKKTYEKVSHTLRLQRVNKSCHLNALPVDKGESESKLRNTQSQRSAQPQQQLLPSSVAVVRPAGLHTQSHAPASLPPTIAGFPGSNTGSHVLSRPWLPQDYPQLAQAMGGFTSFQQFPNVNTSPNSFAPQQFSPFLSGLERIHSLQGMGPSAVELLSQNQLQRERLLAMLSNLHPPR
eukprot:scaffold8206_cov135-Cylindrotheca_fusiformis.AAC.3